MANAIFQLTEFQFSSFQSLSRVRLFATPWTAAHQASLSFTIPKFAQVHVHFISDAIHPSHPLIPSSPLPSISPSIRDFSNESSFHIRCPKYWSFSFSISPSIEYSGLISLTIDWLDLLALQGTFRSLPQHHSLKASILWRSAFFTVQLSQIVISCKQGKIKLQT